MPKCPKCKADIKDLLMEQTEKNDWVVIYDAETEDTEETLLLDSVGMPYAPEIKKREFFCRKCGKPLFKKGKDAVNFLASEAKEQPSP